MHSLYNERIDALAQRCTLFVLCHSGPCDINKRILQLHCRFAWLIPKCYYCWPEVNTHCASCKTYKQTSRLYAQTIPSVSFFNLPLFFFFLGGGGVLVGFSTSELSISLFQRVLLLNHATSLLCASPFVLTSFHPISPPPSSTPFSQPFTNISSPLHTGLA